MLGAFLLTLAAKTPLNAQGKAEGVEEAEEENRHRKDSTLKFGIRPHFYVGASGPVTGR